MTFDTYFSVTSKWPQKCDIEREIKKKHTYTHTKFYVKVEYR